MKKRAVASGSLCLEATGFRDERHLPFSVVEQLGNAPGVPDDVRGAVRPLVGHGAPASPRLLRNLASALASAADHANVVIVVDDAHLMDPASRSCLLYLARRARLYDITMALAFPRTGCGADHLEFLGLPDARLAEAAPLSREDVRELLEHPLGARAAEGLTGPVHRVSGGSPALVTALVRDLLSAGPVRAETPVPIGESFRTAYLSSLVRHPGLARIVEALAVLGEDAAPARVARLLREPLKDIERRIGELEHAGLLEDGGFRHPDIPGAVLGALGTDLPALHRRAARVLCAAGAPATTIARHLVAADERPDAVGVHVLSHAWPQFLTAGQPDRALACLRLTARADLDDPQRAKVSLGLAYTLTCLNPLAAEPEVRRLSAAARAGNADYETLRFLIVWFLLFGHREQGQEMTAILIESYPPTHVHDATGSFRMLVRELWPELLDAPEVRAAFERRRIAGTPTMADEDGDAAVDLRWFSGGAFVSLLRLIDEGELDLADQFCRKQREMIPEDSLPAWHAFMSGQHARVRWQLGDVRAASAFASSALTLLPDHGWGVAVGLPLSVLVASHTAMGRLDQAARHLERPVPDELWHSAFGPMYRIARGGYLLEIGSPRAALEDFLACAPSRAAASMGWRAWAAEAYLALGDVESARRTATEQLGHDERPTDCRGRALLVLASADSPGRRRARLEEAERTLRTAGNRLLLARALVGLARQDLAEGLAEISRTRWSEALELAEEGGFPDRIRRLTALPDEPPTPAVPGPAQDSLTQAERRVASLAAEGRSNRQIATQLYITVSTVEQHLTRVYRKLSVRRRSELADLLRIP